VTFIVLHDLHLNAFSIPPFPPFLKGGFFKGGKGGFGKAHKSRRSESAT
jgi:hypothetical protein